ncbi:MAG: dihydrofolate reductase family protein [Ekhidna sp.]
MKTRNSVFIATSLDGYIADENGGIDWLESVPNPDQIDMGYGKFISEIDALVMGRTTFETVCAFDMDWPYEKPVFVLSNTLTEVPSELKNKVYLVKGTLSQILQKIHEKGFSHLYIDGGKTIQSFLKEDLIDEMIITTIPVLLGGGFPLFSTLTKRANFECINSKIYLDAIVQNHFKKLNPST